MLMISSNVGKSRIATRKGNIVSRSFYPISAKELLRQARLPVNKSFHESRDTDGSAIGSKQRREDEERARIADNQHAAGSAYTAPNPDELEAKDPSGLPWGSVPIKQVFEAGRAAAREKSQQTSREGSTSVGGSSASMHAGGSTRQG